jgi:hypothetical protein
MRNIERPTTPARQTDKTRDDRIEAPVYRRLGWTYRQIADRMKKSMRQIEIACTRPATPKKKLGRRAAIA